MKTSDFREWLEKISQLSRGQKVQVRHYLSEVAPQAAVVKCLEDSFEPNCPVCQADRCYRWGDPSGVATFSLLRVQAHVHGHIENPFGPFAA